MTVWNSWMGLFRDNFMTYTDYSATTIYWQHLLQRGRQSLLWGTCCLLLCCQTAPSPSWCPRCRSIWSWPQTPRSTGRSKGCHCGSCIDLINRQTITSLVNDNFLISILCWHYNMNRYVFQSCHVSTPTLVKVNKKVNIYLKDGTFLLPLILIISKLN